MNNRPKYIIQLKTIKFVKENVKENICDFGLGKDFFKYNTRDMMDNRK